MNEEAFPRHEPFVATTRDERRRPMTRNAPTVTAVKLYLVQHGQAKPEDEDPQRPLTARGADDVTWVAHWGIDRFGVRPSRITHSDKTRARQTAEIWGRLTGVDPEQGDGLAPNDDPTTWARRVAAETADLMLVGHLPHLAKVVSLLLTGDADRQLVGFCQGGLVAVEHDVGWAATLVLPPSAA
jgi:phosphohistidine phosphatase